MNDLQIDSQAFRTALLASERRRIFGVTAFLLIFAIAITARILIFSSHMSPWGAVFLLAVVAYELWTLHEVSEALETGHDLPDWLLWFNILVEVTVPVLGLQSVPGSWLQGCGDTVGARIVSADHAVRAASQSSGFASAWLGSCMWFFGERLLSGMAA